MKKILMLLTIFILGIYMVGCGTTKESDINSLKKMPKFETVDLSGNKVNNEIFTKYDLTMINIWSVNCGPCIEELPDLQKISEEYKDKKFNLLGMLPSSDGEGESKKRANEILTQQNTSYTNFVANQILEDEVLFRVTGTPTTIFVDSKGNIVGKAVVGSKAKEEYEKIINETLNQIKK